LSFAAFCFLKGCPRTPIFHPKGQFEGRSAPVEDLSDGLLVTRNGWVSVQGGYWCFPPQSFCSVIGVHELLA